jgi:hypothetical protein
VVNKLRSKICKRGGWELVAASANDGGAGDGEEDMIAFFHLQGGLVYVDTVENGQMVGYDDGFTLLEIARNHFRAKGLDMSKLDAMVR